MAVSARRRVVISALAAVIAAGGLFVWLDRSSTVTDVIEVKAPSVGELRAFANTKVLFGHQSVGANVISGVTSLYATAGQVGPSVVETGGPSAGEDGVLTHAHVGVNGDPFGKFEGFKGLLGSGLAEDVDVALLKLCYADIIDSTDVDAVFQAHVAMMDELEDRYPNLVVVYTTVPLTTDRSWRAALKAWVGIDDHMGPADNVARQHYNSLIRQKYGQTGRLFDIAAVEAASNQVSTSREHDGETYSVLNPALSSDAGHLNDLGSRLAAAELVRVVAGARGI